MKGKVYTYRDTMHACYLGYVTQAINNNLAPLLFVVFQDQFHISLEMIGSLILMNFVTQIVVDLLAVRFVDRMGYRMAAALAHIASAAGLVLLAVLPHLLDGTPFVGLCIAAMTYAVGGGLTEVIISPIADSLPGEQKAASMSLLHSFYCWGQIVVVLLSTLFIRILGSRLWYLLPLLWALLPLGNLFYFLRVPLMPTIPDNEKTPLKQLFASRIFLLAMVMMVCAGASELAMSQWASLFAEKGLHVSKLMGDLLGPCLFAVFMALSRTGLRRLGGPVEPAPYPDSQRAAGDSLLPDYRPVPYPGAVPAGLCPVRACGEPHVAGIVQPDGSCIPKGRHRHVWGAGGDGGCRLFRGALAFRAGLGPRPAVPSHTAAGRLLWL